MDAHETELEEAVCFENDVEKNYNVMLDMAWDFLVVSPFHIDMKPTFFFTLFLNMNIVLSTFQFQCTSNILSNFYGFCKAKDIPYQYWVLAQYMDLPYCAIYTLCDLRISNFWCTYACLMFYFYFLSHHYLWMKFNTSHAINVLVSLKRHTIMMWVPTIYSFCIGCIVTTLTHIRLS